MADGDVTAGTLSGWKIYGLIVLASLVLAILSSQMFDLKTEHFVVIVVGVALVAVSTLFLPRYNDFLIVSLLCSVPLAAFSKTFFFNEWDHDLKAKAAMRYSGLISLSIYEIILFALYVIWMVRVATLPEVRAPRLQRYDIFPLLLLAACVLSLPGAVEPKAVIFGTFFLMGHLAFYFYLSRHLEYRHLPWVLAAFILAILLEGALGLFQYATGKWLSLAWSRGAGDVGQQYVVPGIENVKRATGTLFDSHSYGIYMAMLAPFPFVLAVARFTRGGYRLFWGGLLLVSMAGVVLSFSRSAWLSAAISLVFVWFIHLMWGQRDILLPTFTLALLGLILSPWWGPLIYERFASAGSDLLESRFEQFPVAWHMWRDNFFFGYGVGNYMDGLSTYNLPGVLELPVHNAFLWVGAETGLLGVVSFFGVAIAAMLRLWRLIRKRRGLISVLALAVFSAIFAYLLDGLTDPLFREPVVYLMYWLCIALSVALVRIDKQREAGES